MTDFEAAQILKRLFAEGEAVIDHINCSYLKKRDSFTITIADAYKACKFSSVASFIVGVEKMTGIFPDPISILRFADDYDVNISKVYKKELENESESGLVDGSGNSLN